LVPTDTAFLFNPFKRIFSDATDNTYKCNNLLHGDDVSAD